MTCCDVEQASFHDVNGNALGASTIDEASAEIPKQIERNGKKYVFRGWKECSDSRIMTYTTKVKVTKYVPVYEEIQEHGTANGTEQNSANRKTQVATIVGLDPEKDFLPKTVSVLISCQR